MPAGMGLFSFRHVALKLRDNEASPVVDSRAYSEKRTALMQGLTRKNKNQVDTAGRRFKTNAI